MKTHERRGRTLGIASAILILVTGLAVGFALQDRQTDSVELDRAFEITGPNSVVFELMSITAPGVLTVQVDWEGDADELILSLEGPPRDPFTIREVYQEVSGSSPLELEFAVPQYIVDSGVTWRVVLRDPQRERTATGRMAISIPFNEEIDAIFQTERISLRSGDLWPRPQIEEEFLARLWETEEKGLHAFISLWRTPVCQVESLQLERAGILRQSFLPGRHAFGFVSANIDLEDEIIVELLKGLTPVPAESKIEPHVLVGDYASFEIKHPDEGLVNYVLNDDETIELSVVFAEDTTLESIQAILDGLTSAHSALSDFRRLVTLDPALLQALAAVDAVEWIESAPVPPLPTNNVTRAAIRVDVVQNATINAPAGTITYAGLTGDGMVIGICDTGVDANHDDLDVAVDVAASHSHGTHVAGIACGSGARSNQNNDAGALNGGTAFQWRGMAPEASILDSNYGLDVASGMLNAIVSQSMDLANHSHIFGLNGNYGGQAEDFDEAIRGDLTSGGTVIPRILHIATTGNNAAIAQPWQGDQVGYYSLVNQSKNSLLVGASNGNTTRLANFSSMGPAHDGRIKPDVVAPGVDVLSTGTSVDNFCCSLTDGDTRNGYCDCSGTSMAAPAVAGVCALLLEAWEDTYLAPLGTTIDANRLLPSTLRAVLMGTAEDIVDGNVRGVGTVCVDVDSNSSGANDNAGRATATAGPDYATGWGRVHAEDAVELLQASRTENGIPVPNRILQDALSQAVVKEHDFVVDTTIQQAGEVRVTLAWDDVESSAASPATNPMLVNDLDLELIDPTGAVHYPWQLGHTIEDASGNPLADNMQLPGTTIQVARPITPTANPSTTNHDYVPQNALTGTGGWVAREGKDHLNNVEQVMVDNLTTNQIGHWTLRVIGFDVQQGPQDFSVVGFPYPDLPDLVASCTQYVTLPGVNQNFTFTWQYQNVGPVPISASTETFTYQVWLSKDFTLDPTTDVKLTDTKQATFTLPQAGAAAVSHTSEVSISQADINTLYGSGTTFQQMLDSDVFLLVQVDSNDSILEHHETNVACVQLARAVDVVLVLDRSGSMTGNVPVSTGTRTKMEILQSSVNLFLDLMRRNASDMLGIVSFSSSSSITVDLALTTYTDSVRTSAKAAVNSLVASGATDIRGALEEAIKQIQNKGDPTHRRVIVFFSDGQKTDGGDPSDTTFLNEFSTNNIHVYSVGYGTEGGGAYSGIDVPLLEKLSNAGPGSGGFFHVTQSAVSLDKFFVNAVAGALQAGVIVDPEGDVAAGGSQVVSGSISGGDETVTFVLTWDDPTSQLDLTVRTPGGQSIALSKASAYGDRISIESGDTYSIMAVRLPLVVGPSTAHAGTWDMTISNPGSTAVHYAAAIVGDRHPEIQLTLLNDQLGDVFEPGDPVNFRVDLQALGPEAAKNAVVTVIPSSPTSSLATLLSSTQVTASELADIPLEIGGETLSHRQRLLMALEARAGTSLVGATTCTPFTLQRSSWRMPLSGSFTQTSIPGTYEFIVRVETFLACCEPYQREFTKTITVTPKPSLDDTEVFIQTVKPGLPWEALVQVIPSGLDGEPIGPGAFVQIDGVDPAAIALDGVIDGQDGSYTRRFTGSIPSGISFVVTINGTRLEPVRYDPCVDSDAGLVVGVGQGVSTLDPRLITTLAERQVTNSIFEPLFLLDPETGTPMPWIAKAWEILSDDVTRFYIREGIRFHNGEDLTAEDVAFTLEWIADPANGSPRAADLYWMGGVEVVDEYTIDVHTDADYAPFAPQFAFLDQPIVPRDTILDMGDEEFGYSPVGSGAYRFDEWILGELVSLKRYEDYWAACPSFYEVVYRIILESSVMALELEAGGIDIATSVAEQDVPRFEANPEIEVLQTGGLGIVQLFFNLKSPIAGDIRFRQAVYESTDWDQLIEEVLPGAVRAYGSIPPMMWTNDREFLKHEVAYVEADNSASQLFEELRAEGILPLGHSIRILTSFDDQRRVLSEVLASELLDHDIDTEVIALEWGALMDVVARRGGEPGDFEMVWLGWSGGADPHEYLHPLFHSDNAAVGSTLNPSRTRLSEVDWLIDEAGHLLDLSAREENYIQAQRMIYENVSAIPGYHPSVTQGVRASIGGYIADPQSNVWITTPYHNVGKTGGCD